MKQGRGSEAEVEQRRLSVLRRVAQEGEVRIDALAKSLGVSAMTVHRDLDNLHARQLLVKRRAVAVAFPPLIMETAVRFRETLHAAEKAAMAEVLGAQVKPGSTVLMDCGTTLFPLARHLATVEGLRVITNSLRLAHLLGASGDTEVTLIGDRFHPDFESCAGPEALRRLERIRADVAFTTATAVSDGRLYHPVQAYAELKEALQRAAERVVLATDGSKFGRTATHGYGDLGRYDLVVTDASAPAEEIGAVRRLGVVVRTVRPAGAGGTADDPPRAPGRS